jgi:hypothetical protein
MTVGLGACKGTSALCVASGAGQTGARSAGQQPRRPDTVGSPQTLPSCPEQITISAGGESQEDAGEAGRVLASGHKENLPVLSRADHDQRGRRIPRRSGRGRARPGVRSQGEPARLVESRSRSARAASPGNVPARPGASWRQVTRRTCPSCREQITISAGGQSRENPGEAGRGLASGHNGEPARLAQSRSARAASPGKVPARPGAAWSQRTKDARGFTHRTPKTRTHARGFKHRTPKTKKRTREGFKHRNPEQEPARLAQSRSRSARAASPGNVPARPGPVWRQVTTENLPVFPRADHDQRGRPVAGKSRRGRARSGVRSQRRTCPSCPEQITISAGGQSWESPGEAGRSLESAHEGRARFHAPDPQSKNARARFSGTKPRNKNARARFQAPDPQNKNARARFQAPNLKTRKRTREGFKHRNPEQEPARLAQSRSRSARAANSKKIRRDRRGLVPVHEGRARFQAPNPKTRTHARGFKHRTPKQEPLLSRCSSHPDAGGDAARVGFSFRA